MRSGIYSKRGHLGAQRSEMILFVAIIVFLLLGGLFLYETSSTAWSRAYERIRKDH